MSEFASWYAVYPRHTGRAAAEAAFERSLKRGASLQELLAGAMRYRDDPHRRRQDPRFTCLAATWLNQDRHLDEYPEPEQITYLTEKREMPDQDFPSAMELFPQIRPPEEGYVEPHICKVLKR